MATTPETEQEMGECTKCASMIPTKADRCPECGHEPGPGWGGGAIMWAALMVGLLCTVIALSSLVIIADGASITTGLFGVLLFGGVAAGCFKLVQLGHREEQRGPTDPPQFEQS